MAPSGATVTLFGVAGGANEVYASTLSPFHIGEPILLDSEIMFVTGKGTSFGYGYLKVLRFERTTHVIGTPIQLPALVPLPPAPA